MNRIKLFIMLILLSGAGISLPREANAQQVNVNLTVFKNDLGRYGRWVSLPRYGEVWIYNEPGFRPYYTRGHWEYTNFGWNWVSDYPWGWAAFHYGRWELDPYYGWIWIPDYQWAPAWVTWSQYDGGYGWAPLGFGLSVNISFGAVPYNRWIFVPRQDICRPDFHRYRINPGVHRVQNAVIINNVYVNNNIRFARGPQREEVERYTRTPIQQRNIEYGRPHELLADNNRPSGGNSPAIQRPTRPATGTNTPVENGINTPVENGRTDDRPINRPGSGFENGFDRSRGERITSPVSPRESNDRQRDNTENKPEISNNTDRNTRPEINRRQENATAPSRTAGQRATPPMQRPQATPRTEGQRATPPMQRPQAAPRAEGQRATPPMQRPQAAPRMESRRETPQMQRRPEAAPRMEGRREATPSRPSANRGGSERNGSRRL